MPTRILFFLLLLLVPRWAMAQTQEQESNVKAAFIYNFTKYVDWDSSSATDDFIIGVMGPTPLTVPLNDIAQTKTVDSRRIVVRVFNKPEDIDYCAILIIPKSNPFPLRSILDRLGHKTLTIGEQPGMGRKGAAFNLVIVNNKLKFEVNLKTLSEADLKASSQLLKLAIIIDNP